MFFVEIINFLLATFPNCLSNCTVMNFNVEAFRVRDLAPVFFTGSVKIAQFELQVNMLRLPLLGTTVLNVFHL